MSKEHYVANSPDLIITPEGTHISYPATRNVTTIHPASIILKLKQEDYSIGVPPEIGMTDLLNIIKAHYEKGNQT